MNGWDLFDQYTKLDEIEESISLGELVVITTTSFCGIDHLTLVSRCSEHKDDYLFMYYLGESDYDG